MSKFVGKFRKNKEYNDDYSYMHSKHRNEHAEIQKLKNYDIEDLFEEEEYTELSLPQKS